MQAGTERKSHVSFLFPLPETWLFRQRGAFWVLEALDSDGDFRPSRSLTSAAVQAADPSSGMVML